MYVDIQLSIYTCIHIYMCMCICMYIYTNIYTYVHTYSPKSMSLSGWKVDKCRVSARSETVGSDSPVEFGPPQARQVMAVVLVAVSAIPCAHVAIHIFTHIVLSGKLDKTLTD